MGTGPSVLGIFPRSASRCLMASQSCSGGLATDAETPRGQSTTCTDLVAVILLMEAINIYLFIQTDLSNDHSWQQAL